MSMPAGIERVLKSLDLTRGFPQTFVDWLKGLATGASLDDGSVTTAKLADGALAATALGTDKMAAGFFRAAVAACLAFFADGFWAATDAARGKFAASFLGNTAVGRALMEDGYFDAADASRNKFAASFLGNTAVGRALMEDGYFAATDASRAKFAADFLGNTAAGRALMQDGFIDTTGITTKFTATCRPSRHRGSCMTNRLPVAAQPGAGETVVYGADVYEFRAVTPPLGGTAGRIWVYNGGAGGAVAARANLLDALNGTIDAARITRTPEDPTAGTNTELVVMDQPVVGVLRTRSATSIGGTPFPSATVVVCTHTLVGIGDGWEGVAGPGADTYGGRLETAQSVGFCSVILAAAQIGMGTIRFTFPFTPTGCRVTNRSRPHDEAYTIAANDVVLTLTGGVSPNNQPGDVLDVDAWE